jgi:pumilio family protein 6
MLVQNILISTVVLDIELKKKSVDSVVKIVSSDGLYHEAKEEANMHVIERQGFSFVLKKLIKNDTDGSKKSDVGHVVFSERFVELVSKEVLRSYIGCNKGCFLLLNLLETNIPSVVKKVTASLDGLNRTLGQKTFKGAQLLLEKIKTSSK